MHPYAGYLYLLFNLTLRRQVVGMGRQLSIFLQKTVDFVDIETLMFSLEKKLLSNVLLLLNYRCVGKKVYGIQTC